MLPAQSGLNQCYCSLPLQFSTNAPISFLPYLFIFNLFFFLGAGIMQRQAWWDYFSPSCQVSVSVPLALPQLNMLSEQKPAVRFAGIIFCNIYLAAEERLNKELTGFVRESVYCMRLHALQRKQSWGNSRALAIAWLLHSTLGELVTCPVSGSSVSLLAIPQVTSSWAWLAFVYFACV